MAAAQKKKKAARKQMATYRPMRRWLDVPDKCLGCSHLAHWTAFVTVLSVALTAWLASSSRETTADEMRLHAVSAVSLACTCALCCGMQVGPEDYDRRNEAIAADRVRRELEEQRRSDVLERLERREDEVMWQQELNSSILDAVEVILRGQENGGVGLTKGVRDIFLKKAAIDDVILSELRAEPVPDGWGGNREFGTLRRSTVKRASPYVHLNYKLKDRLKT